MNISRIAVALCALVVATLQADSFAQFYQNPGYFYGPPALSTGPQPNWSNPGPAGGPMNTYSDNVYWGRFMPGRNLGYMWGTNRTNVNGFEYDPISGKNVYVQGTRWTNPFTGQPHGDVTVTSQNPDGSFKSERTQYSRPNRGNGNKMPGRAVGR